MQAQSRQPTTLPPKLHAIAGPVGQDSAHGSSEQPEPLLSLLTSQHPLLSTAINGSLSAYASSKSYSPRFRYGAEFVERHIGSPVVSTVGTASRLSGVETGVRWWLQRSEHASPDQSTKRRKLEEQTAGGTDVEKGLDDSSLHGSFQRRFSDMSVVESLPPYDECQLPGYEANSESSSNERQSLTDPRMYRWQARFAISTSGLGVSMREESLRSLKYCLKCLHWANDHLNAIVVSLRKAIDEWNSSHQSSPSASGSNPVTESGLPPGPGPGPEIRPRDAATLSRHIKILTKEVLQTLNKIIDVVSTYAGGALPENARDLVRKQLNSFPQRFRMAFSHSQNSESGLEGSHSETVSSANRILVLAREGLNMLHQVSGVVDGTIVSAEDWLVRLGKKNKSEEGIQNSTTFKAEETAEKSKASNSS